MDKDSDTKIQIDKKDFCDAFEPYGSQVTETEGDVFVCKVRMRIKTQFNNELVSNLQFTAKMRRSGSSHTFSLYSFTDIFNEARPRKPNGFLHMLY